jgi:mannose-6-phosphate isomerase-like protein (cupin superfamily)
MHHARQRRTLVSLPTIKPKRAEILKCIARFSELPGVSKGLPDMALDGCHRTFYSVLGFSQPKGEEAFSPFGDAVKPKITHVRSGFGLAYVAAQPGQCVLMHNHDTVESFLVIEGRWKLEWEGDPGDDHVILEPKDFITFPVGVQRRFECVEAAAGKKEGFLLAIIQGEAPIAEFSPEARQRLVEAEIFPA